MMRFFCIVVNRVVPKDIISWFSGLYFGVVIMNTCRCSNLSDGVIEIGCPVRISMHFFNTGAVLFHLGI